MSSKPLSAKRLSPKQKKLLQALLARASGAVALGRMDILAHLCDQMDSIQANHPDTASFRGMIAIRAGETERAIEYFNMALTIAPARSEFYINLAAVYLLQGRIRKALAIYRQALDRDKHAPESLFGCASCLMKLGEYEQALQVLRQFPGMDRSGTHHIDERVGMLASQVCIECRCLDEAGIYLLRILECKPDHAGAHYRMALLAMYAGRLDDALTSARHAIAADAGHADAFKLLTDLRRFSDAADPELLAMQALYEQTASDAPERMTLAFALGKAMHDLKRYECAFDFFQQANSMRRQSFSYDHASALAGIQRIMQPEGKIPASAGYIPDGPVPIFIVGMPRCGSTLVEQILAAHPDVESRGEGNAFRLAAGGLAAEVDAGSDIAVQPVDLSGYSSDQWHALGAAYLDRLRCVNAGCVTDKTLPNFIWLGAIHAALPHAKIIHVRRNPLDNCWSIYRTSLQGDDFHFGFELTELGEYYAAYLKLMRYWRETLPPGVMYEVDYEQLVADQQGETRKLLDACGLAWHEGCLQFDRAGHGVLTASAVQVRSAINTASVAAWQRYEQHLQPLIRILGRQV